MSVERESNHTIGRASVDITASGRAVSRAHRSARCMAMRLGASSPNTSVTYDSTRVTTMIDTGRAAPPRKSSGSSSGSASDTAAAAEARNPASVMPIWMVAKKLLGSRARRATSAPVLERCSSRWSWPSRSDTSASSVPANTAFSSTSTATRAI